MQDLVPTVLIPSAAAVGVVFAVLLWQKVSQITLTPGSTFRSQNGREYLLVSLQARAGGWKTARARLYEQGAREGGVRRCTGDVFRDIFAAAC